MALTKNTKTLIIGGIIIGLGGLGYVFRNKIKSFFVPVDPNPLPPFIDPNILPPVPDPNILPPGPDVDKNKLNIDARLIKGNKDDNVKSLQYNIREIQSMLGVPLIKADGDFGKNTRDALLIISDFFKKNGYWTIRKARETVARYKGEKKLPFPSYLVAAENYSDLKKIYDTASL